jgi:hypothetical protein
LIFASSGLAALWQSAVCSATMFAVLRSLTVTTIAVTVFFYCISSSKKKLNGGSRFLLFSTPKSKKRLCVFDLVLLFFKIRKLVEIKKIDIHDRKNLYFAPKRWVIEKQ